MAGPGAMITKLLAVTGPGSYPVQVPETLHRVITRL